MVAMITADCVLSLDGQLEEGEMPGGGEDGEEMFKTVRACRRAGEPAGVRACVRKSGTSPHLTHLTSPHPPHPPPPLCPTD